MSVTAVRCYAIGMPMYGLNVIYQVYLQGIEKSKLRFADALNVEYDIQTTDFELPILSIQPLVENAVKHGVGMKKYGGTVKISTGETDSA